MGRTTTYCRAKTAPVEALADYLAAKFKYFDRAGWEANIANGLVAVNGAGCADAERVLKQQDKITYSPPQALEPAVDTAIAIVRVDDDVVVVRKTGNLPVAEGGRYSSNTLTRVAAKLLSASTAEASAAEQRLLPVHRLDKETSGLVVMARTKAAAAALCAQFRCHADALAEVAAAAGHADRARVEAATKWEAQRVARDAAGSGGESAPPVEVTAQLGVDAAAGEKRPTAPAKRARDDSSIAATAADDSAAATAPVDATVKEYEAVVVGTLADAVTVELNIGFATEADGDEKVTPSAGNTLAKVRMCCYPKDGARGKPALTVVTPVKSGGGLTLVRVQLFTGRTHQIRLHCAAIGFPVLGDKMYVAGGGAVSDEVYLARARGEAPVEVALPGRAPLAVPRHMLHAASLAFRHPAAAPGAPQIVFTDDAMVTFARECPMIPKILDADDDAR
jgi:23S rRNA-/tRNA-specific pseudouridylate synthase